MKRSEMHGAEEASTRAAAPLARCVERRRERGATAHAPSKKQLINARNANRPMTMGANSGIEIFGNMKGYFACSILTEFVEVGRRIGVFFVLRSHLRVSAPPAVILSPPMSQLPRLALLLSCVVLTQSQSIITTYLGNGTETSTGDGASPSAATTFWPKCMAYDACSSTFYFAEAPLNSMTVIRAVQNGVVRRIASGNLSSSFFSEDGGPATAASFGEIIGMALGPDGSVFITDISKNKIWRVSLDGKIFVFAGNGRNSSTGDGGPAINASFTCPWSQFLPPPLLFLPLLVICLFLKTSAAASAASLQQPQSYLHSLAPGFAAVRAMAAKQHPHKSGMCLG